MVILRSGSNTKGAAAPSYGSNELETTHKAKERAKKSVSNDMATGRADRRAASRDNEGTNRRGMPGEFAASPISPNPEPSDSSDEQEEDWVGETVAGPAERSIGDARRNPSTPCLSEERASERDQNPSEPHPSKASASEPASQPSEPHPSQDRAAHAGHSGSPHPASTHAWSITPSFFADAEATVRDSDPAKSTNQFHTPSRKARDPTVARQVSLDGPRYFPNIISIENTSIHEDEVAEPEDKSDETLRQYNNKRKSRSAAQEKAEDLAYMRAIIKDNRRLQRLRSTLPDIIPNDKTLLAEMTEALRDSSGAEDYIPSDYELETNTPQVETRVIGQTAHQSQPEHTKVAPSYFDKGKWLCDEDYEAQQAHKRKVETSKPSREAPTRARKTRPSIGITIDDLVPKKPTAEKRAWIPNVNRDIEASIAALPEGGYFADKMRETFLAKEKKAKKAKKLRAYSPEKSESPGSDSDESTSSNSSSSSGPSSSSSSSSTSSGSISDSKRKKNRRKREKYRSKEKTRKEQRENKRLRRQIRELKRASIKVKEPEKYRGQEDFDAFEMWDYQVNSWLRKTGYKGTEAVEWLGSMLSGKASRWYMDYVAPNPSLYTVESLRLALYMYCFPPDMKAKLRSEFSTAKQGNQKFADYVRHLKRLQRRLPDITDRNLCIKLWETVHTYIRVKWTEAGLAQEVTNLETLTEMAERFEAAEEIKRRSQPRSWQQRSDHQRQTRQNQQGQQPPSKAPEQNPKGESSKHSSNSKAKNGKVKEKPKSDKPKLSRDERDELRAAGKCFNCKEHGHTVKDCPLRNKAKPTDLFSAAIQYKKIDELRKEREQSYIGVASIRPLENSSPASSQTVLSEITPGKSLLEEVLDEITPYSQIVVAETDRLKVTNEEAREIQITYREIAKLVRNEYLHQLERRAQENNLGTASDAEDQADDESEGKEEADQSWESVTWSDSDSDVEQLTLELNALRPDKGKKPESSKTIERNASKPRDVTRRLPKPIIAEVMIEGKKVRALFDSGSLGDFISTTVVDQLRLKREPLANPIGLQMAVQGSRSMINYSVDARISFQTIDYTRRFDVINIDNYDMILGTPFLFQHKILMGFNPPSVAVGSAKPLPIDGDLAIELKAHVAELFENEIEKCREKLRAAGAGLCKTMAETSLPPFRAINHTIPLIDESKRYHSRRVQCPKPLQELWDEKFRAYLDTGRWEYRPGSNAIPMLILMKKAKDGKTAVRTVLDKREINANTHKLASPLPDINDILAEVSRHPYRSLIDGKDAYEQIRVVPEHVERTLFMTPNGTMISKVMQQGDCNAGATYQALMNHIFADFIGKFMFVYLDDIIIFSDTVEDHMKHVKMVFDVLKREKLYLSPNKMQLFAERLEILGHVITSDGIAMDPHKVDAVDKWKVPTTKEQIMSFLGAVGYLAPNCPNVRIPMSILSKRAAASQPWRWEATEQRAFQEIKDLVVAYRDHNRVALDYSPGAPPINLTTDACCTGAAGVISQGEDLKTAKVAAFWSGKFTATQQNYPVHEQELLAIKESLERFRHIVQGVPIRVYTDHKALEYFSTQQKLSARQTRWMEKINEFDIEVKYIPGETNILADGLSRMYSNEPKGVERAKSEYVAETDQETPHILVGSTGLSKQTSPEVTRPLYIGDEVKAKFEILQEPRRSTRARKQVDKYGQQPTPDRKPRSKRVTVEEVVDKEAPVIVAQKKAAETTKEEGKAEPQQPEPRPKPDLLEAEEKTPLVKCVTEAQLPDCIVGRYQDDTLLRIIAKEPEKYSNFEIKNEVLYMRKDNELLMCIPDISIGERKLREIIITHAHSILAHLGAKKTLQWLRTQVWWKTMVKDVYDYCESCHVCAISKSGTQKPQGLLHPMPIPSYPWQSIGIDFVGPLPESETRYGKFDMIMTVIDNLTRMLHLIPTKQTYKAKDIAEVIFEHVYKLHGMPEMIVSDRDSLFTSTFWKELAKLTKTELKMSSAYHPQTDGMTERAQRTYTGILRICAGDKQNEWAGQLPAIEFAINSARSEATGLAPFYLNYGRVPSPMVHETTSKYPGVKKHIENIKLAIMTAHDALLDARVRMTKQANEHRRPADYQIGQLVYVSTKNMRIPKGSSRKMTFKYIGPYKITREITARASYEIELGKDLRARGIHPVFHASLLRPHIPVDDRRFPGRDFGQVTSIGNAPQEWAVDRITSHKGKGRTAIFELLWKTGDRTWEPYRHIRHLEALEVYCEAQGVPNAGKLPIGTSEETESDIEEEKESIPVNAISYIKGQSGRPDHPSSLTKPLLDSLTRTRPAYTMSTTPNHISMTTEALQIMLGSQANVQIEANRTLLQLARETGQRLENISIQLSRRERKQYNAPYKKKQNQTGKPHVGRRQKKKQKNALARSSTATPNPIASPTDQITDAMMGMSFSELMGISPGPISMTTPAYSPPSNPNSPATTPTAAPSIPVATPLMPAATPSMPTAPAAKPQAPVVAPITVPLAPTTVAQPTQPIGPNSSDANVPTQAQNTNETQDEVIDYEDNYTMEEVDQGTPKTV